MKIFLSHSSTDKAIVKRVYEELGAALCHFDEATFNPTGSISEEIFKTLNESTHFVLFASPAAIGSKWVQGELHRAFESWMRAGARRALVFLLDGAAVGDLPDWLHQYVMREPPTYRHILCRIQSEIDKDLRHQNRPPSYRPDELQQLERMLLVETSGMPGAILIHGPDGSGRKELINELYERQFPGIAARKLLIATSTYTTETELFRDVVGLTTIATPTEFSAIFKAFDSLDHANRIYELVRKIEQCAAGNQVLLIEGDYSLFSEDGRLPDWLVEVICLLAGREYPVLAMTGFRRPVRLPVKLIDKLIVQEVPDLDKDRSRILFNWWIRALKKPYTESLKDLVFDACSGSPRQLELGAKLLVAEGAGNVSKIKPHLLNSLEGLSRQFLDGLSHSLLNSIILAFVANAGYITRSDLTQYIGDANIASTDDINEAIAVCASFGFLVEDEVCLRMPNYLIRGARAIGRDRGVSDELKKLWSLQSKSAASLALDEVTSIPVLNEYSLSILRSGENVGPIFESIILPSQCVQVARSMYESEKYVETLALCERAYESRAALSKDGLVEALRYMGMAAARLGNHQVFDIAINRFSDVNDSIKATRISNFLQGFRKRLDGKFDDALGFLNAAYKAKGELDVHILRELASITLNLDDVTAARRYIKSALGRASSNQYVIEMAIRVELFAAPAVVSKRSSEIEFLLEKLYSFDSSPDKIYWIIGKCDYFLALNETKRTEDLLGNYAAVSSPALELVRARILIQRKSYAQAKKLLESLYQRTKALKTGQRQSTLPIICRSLVEAAFAYSVVEGIDWFLTAQPYLPMRISRVLAGQMLETIAHTREQVPTSNLAILKNIAGRS